MPSLFFWFTYLVMLPNIAFSLKRKIQNIDVHVWPVFVFTSRFLYFMICFSRYKHVEPTALTLVEQIARQPSIRFELLFENLMRHSLGQLPRERRGWETHLYQQYQVWPRGWHGSHHRFSCLYREFCSSEAESIRYLSIGQAMLCHAMQLVLHSLVV